MLVVNDAGTEGILTTGSIDISEGPVNISLDLWSDGNLESDDYVKLYKKEDDGPETLIGSKTGNQNITNHHYRKRNRIKSCSDHTDQGILFQ